MKCQSCGDRFDKSEGLTQMLKCKNCGHIGDNDAGPRYECTGCKTIFTKTTSAKYNHQCPKCNKFGLKIAESGCLACEGEMELTDVIECPTCGVAA